MVFLKDLSPVLKFPVISPFSNKRGGTLRETKPGENKQLLLKQKTEKSRRDLKDVEPDLLLPRPTQTDAWVIQDCGGSGDCAFRAIARAFAQIQKKDIPKEKITAEAAQLRVLAVGSGFPDPQELSELRCGNLWNPKKKPLKSTLLPCGQVRVKTADGFVASGPLPIKLNTDLVCFRN